MTHVHTPLRSQRLRLVNHQGDALRLGMNWTEEDLGKPQVLVDSADGMGHPGTFHFRTLVDEVSNGVYEAGGKPGVFTVSDICDGVIQATDGMSYSLVSRDIMAAMVEIHALGHPHDWIAGAGLDDIEEEPAKVRDWKPVNPLFTLPNVVVTPHAAYYSEEAIHTVRDFAAHEVVRVLTGQPPVSPVNADQLSA